MLNNGAIVEAKGKGIFLVATSAGAQGNYKYCTMYNLADGTRPFSEPCSRKTTRARIASHLRTTANNIVVHKKESFEIRIQLLEGYYEDEDAVKEEA